MSDEKVIEIQDLSKQFKEVKAVNHLDLNVYRGDVLGFLGPNGAGKSTTIRMMLSLIKPSAGRIKIFGQSLKEHRKKILRRIGAIVEKPDFYMNLTAYKNIEILGRLSGVDTSKQKIMGILELVGLAKRYNSKVKTFSHGMKQRLGIAQALFHDPDLIVLDEPTTGLDPQGMKEIRDLIIHLSKDKGKTVFLSSHILPEVEIVANRMVIINKGTTVVEGTVNELLNSGNLKVTFEIDNPDRAAELINTSGWKQKLNSHSNREFFFTLRQEEISILNRYLITNDVSVSAVIPTRSLEEYFLALTEGNQ